MIPIAPGIPSNIQAIFPNSSSLLVSTWNQTSADECTIKYDICLCLLHRFCSATLLDYDTSIAAECRFDVEQSLQFLPSDSLIIAFLSISFAFDFLVISVISRILLNAF